MKELKLSLLNHYLMVMEMVREEESLFEIYDILRDTFTGWGVCHCGIGFGEHIYNALWVKNHSNNFNKWGAYPIGSITKSEVLSRLQIRVDILQKEIV